MENGKYEIDVLAQKICEKRSWIKKEFKNFIPTLNKKINEKLKNCFENLDECDFESEIDYIVRSYYTEEHDKVLVILRLLWSENGVRVELKKLYNGSEINIDRPSLKTIRTIASKIQEILDFFANDLTKKNDIEYNCLQQLKNFTTSAEVSRD